MPWRQALRGGSRAAPLGAALQSEDPYELLLRLTALLLLLFGSGPRYSVVAIRIVACAALISPSLVRRQWVWWFLAIIQAAGTMRVWHSADNHQYLITYWVMACAIATGVQRPTTLLASTARLLVALVFCLATLWKLVAGEYLDGSFFQFTLITDGRVRPVASTLLGTHLDDVSVAADAIRYLGTTGDSTLSVRLPTGPTLVLAATLLSWMGVLVEGTVGVLHLMRRWYIPRHIALIGFVMMTYYLFPVTGFGATLAILGLAQCDGRDWPLRLTYIILLACVQLTMLPWQTLLT